MKKIRKEEENKKIIKKTKKSEDPCHPHLKVEMWNGRV